MSFKIGNIEIGLDKPFFVIAGPCVIESEEHCLDIAHRLCEISKKVGMPIIFKSSFDKANRTSVCSYRGPGLHEGLRILEKVCVYSKLPIITDIHEPEQANIAANVVDALQIPAFLCRQTDLIYAAAKTGLPVNIKKGQWMSPEAMWYAAGKVELFHDQVMVTERGTFFGYDNLVNDMTAISTMQEANLPVLFDATHSVQCPAVGGTGGRRDMAPILAKAAVAAGANGLYVEVHDNVEQAKSDASSVMPIDWLEDLLLQCRKIHEVVR
ncbi:MAG: 3-deoxy-8-phosphooctulonate synthase [Candidatus Heimdallarchaeaceae archaeon]